MNRLTPYDVLDGLSAAPPVATDDVPLSDEETRALEAMMRKVSAGTQAKEEARWRNRGM